MDKVDGIGCCVREIPFLPSASVSRSSSIGRNSDCETCREDGGEAEVQSSYKGPLETMDALEDSLPISRRGISKFYCGRSKSFAVLSDTMTKLPSARELGKPENAYNRKRKKFMVVAGASKKRQANCLTGTAGAASSPSNQGRFSCYPPARSFSLLDFEAIESLSSSSSSSLCSMGSEEQKGFI